MSASPTSTTSGVIAEHPNSNNSNTTSNRETKKYDVLLLLGSTSSTAPSVGKLAVEYLLHKQQNGGGVQWAVLCTTAAEASKCRVVLRGIVDRVNYGNDDSRSRKRVPDVVVADCDAAATTTTTSCSAEQKDALAGAVARADVVLNCSDGGGGGGANRPALLVKLCAQLGKDYAAAVAGSSGGCCGDAPSSSEATVDRFVRQTIASDHRVAVRSGARILHHCGYASVPHDLMVYEMDRYAKRRNMTLVKAQTCAEFCGICGGAGGGGNDTTTPFLWHDDDGQDPMYMVDRDGKASAYKTRDISPKNLSTAKEFGKLRRKHEDGYSHDDEGDEYNDRMIVEPWMLGSTTVNCVRRSNALLRYSEKFEYGDMVYAREGARHRWLKELASMLPGSMRQYVVPALLPGPVSPSVDREALERASVSLHGIGVVVDKTTKKKSKLVGKFHFNKDVAYLYTAAFLVETGILLLETRRNGGTRGVGGGGVLTPAAAFGTQLTQRILDKLDATLELKEIYEEEREIKIVTAKGEESEKEKRNHIKGAVEITKGGKGCNALAPAAMQ